MICQLRIHEPFKPQLLPTTPSASSVSTYAPYPSQIALVTSLEDSDVEAMTDTMGSSRYTRKTCPNYRDARPAEASMRRWRSWGEQLVEDPLKPGIEPKHGMEFHIALLA